MDKLYVLDTNTFLDYPELIFKYDCVLLTHINRELEKHKSSYIDELKYKARQLTRFIEENIDRITLDFKDYKVSFNDQVDAQYTDNKIIQACLDNNYGLVTGDVLLRQHALGLGINAIKPTDEIQKKETREWCKEITISIKELNKIYENLDDNKWGLDINEYLIVFDSATNESVDAFKWDGQYLHRVGAKGFTTNMFGKFKPYDHYQQCALDSIQSNKLTCIKGFAGSGKSLITLSSAWSMIERGKYDKLIIFTNPVKTKGSAALGFYKGSRTEKLLDSQIGIMLSAKFGDDMAVQMAINNNKLQLLPFSDIRGFDTSGQKAIVWFTEAQNLDTELMKLGLQRIGDDSKAIVDGDPNTQVDMEIYKTNNGMNRMSEVFRGTEMYGEVTLKNIYRSEIAAKAEEM